MIKLEKKKTNHKSLAVKNKTVDDVPISVSKVGYQKNTGIKRQHIIQIKICINYKLEQSLYETSLRQKMLVMT